MGNIWKVVVDKEPQSMYLLSISNDAELLQVQRQNTIMNDLLLQLRYFANIEPPMSMQRQLLTRFSNYYSNGPHAADATPNSRQATQETYRHRARAARPPNLLPTSSSQ